MHGIGDRNGVAAEWPASDGIAQSEGGDSNGFSDPSQSNESGHATRSLVDGLSNDKLWLLLRRFDKVYETPTSTIRTANEQ